MGGNLRGSSSTKLLQGTDVDDSLCFKDWNSGLRVTKTMKGSI